MVVLINCKDGSKQKINLGDSFAKRENGKPRTRLEMESVLRDSCISIVTPANYRSHNFITE